MKRPRLIYVANNRLPTEKAHGLQIVQMCEAFVTAGCDVTLITARRVNTPEMRAVENLWAYYDVEPVFGFCRLPCLDLLQVPLLRRAQQAAFVIQTLTYLLALVIWLLPRRAEITYTRELLVGVVLALMRRRGLVYEVHQVHHSRLGRWLQAFLVWRALVVPVTGHLAEKMRALGAQRVLVEHDGVRLARFADLPSKAEARTVLSIPPKAFVIGYVGRLHTMQMSKGLDTLVDAIAEASVDRTIHLLIVGGPQAGIETLRVQWIARGLLPERLHTAGQVPPEAVPRYLAAMDVGAMPLPWTEHFAYYASAIKLFEYMAAGCAVLASDLPSTAEVVRDGQSALLCPPGDVAAFASAIRRLEQDQALRERLAKQARANVIHYAWDARATRIRAFVEKVV